MTRYGQTMAEALKGINEKLKPSDGAGAYVKDFKKSDAPQFKGKSDEKKQKMAIAAYLDDKEENMNIGMNEKMMKGFVVRYTDKNGERLAVPYKTRDRAKEEVKALKKLGAKDIEITTHNLNFKEEDDHEISMARGELEAISDKALELSSALEGKPDVGNPLEAWVQSKITKAKDYINSVSDYLLYNPDIKMEEKAPVTKVNEVAPVAMALGKVAARAAGAAAGTAVANKVMGEEVTAVYTDKKTRKVMSLKFKDIKSANNFFRANRIAAGQINFRPEETQEAVSPEQQAAIAISKKEKEKDDAILVDKKVKKEKTKFEAYTGVPNPRTEGRKSNYATDDEDEEGANKNIIMQLYKAISLRGRFDVVFDDGKKEKVKEPIAQKAIAIHRTFKTSRDRLAFQNKISKSYRDLLNAIR